ncbi:MAG: carbohydrate ABC transporter permease [Spirochaetaceae bacterium]|jgi:ABC-type glycerol-3-phosphate transport system permease component|nr:carbohydrate ABC transporter permease [Spirochaetaceae bacterium]
MQVKKDKISRAVTAFSVGFITVFALLCLIPFVMMVSASFSSEAALNTQGISVFPRDFSVETYKLAFKSPKQLLGSYGVTIGLTVFGTALGLFLIAMTGYALYRPDFFLRNKISFFFYFTTLFSAGLAPSYIWMTRYLGMKNNYLAVFLPLLMSPWLILLMRNFMKSIPFEITESGKIDGAGDFNIFISLIFPMIKPALATIGLFLALSYWNEWYNSMLYLPDLTYKPLQYFLYRIVNEAAALRQSMAGSNVVMRSLPTTTLKMTTAVLATGPIILLYPFVQKYFISGITIGAVKG